MKVRWPWRREQVNQRSLISITDPVMAELLGGGGTANYSGVDVGEGTALGVSAVYRAVALISQTIAQLPLLTILVQPDGTRERSQSLLDDPGGPDGPTAFEWKETVLLHLLLHGNAFLLHVYGGAGQLVALVPVHPLNVGVEERATWPGQPNRKVLGGRLFTVPMLDGSIVEHDKATLTHIPAMTTDGVRGLSPIALARQGIGTAIAGERAAANMFNQGGLISGLVSLDGDDSDPDDADTIRETLERRVSGWENASGVRFINRKLKFTSWTMSAEDRQFLESRAFQVEEIARWFGVPPHLLMQTEKQTSWGTGVAESNRGMGRTVLAPWASRIEQRLTRVIAGRRIAVFDFTGLERPSPEAEATRLSGQVDAGLMTINEARAALNLAPIASGDVLRIKGVPLDAAAPEPTGDPA